MPLTNKEKRVVVTPLSFSSKQRKNAKFRTRKKIFDVIEDMRFLVEHRDEISVMFGIDVLEGGVGVAIVPKPPNVTVEKCVKKGVMTKPADPDLL